MKIAAAVVLLALIIGGAVYFSRSSSDEPSAVTEENTTQSVPTESTSPEQMPSQSPGAYVDYSDTVVANTAGTKILFFHAPWCPQCRALESSIKSSTIPDGVTIIKVDYDTHQSLRQKYGVTIQTTLVRVDDDGNLVKRYVAYDEPTFASLKANLL